MTNISNRFFETGWAAFPPEASVAAWAAQARFHALVAARDTAHHADQLRCGGTWFVGLDAVPNDREGRIENGPALTGRALEFAQSLIPKPLPLHPAQVSIVYPGYPQHMVGESPAAFGYRLNRDAAHLDGLLPVGPDRRRYLKEPHAFVLGIPVSHANAQASPLVIWEGSHKIFRSTFAHAFADIPSSEWTECDITDLYQNTRREVFERCRRIELSVPLGGAYVIHRLALHGVAPWREGADAAPEGRMIAYFRPELTHVSAWLQLD
jgi:hypothetical protein